MFWVQRMLAGIRARGESCDAVLAGARIPTGLLEQPDARITGEQYATLFRLLMESRGDEGLGFLSRKLKPGSFALTARLSASARSLGHAVHRSSEALGLLQDDFTLDQPQDGKLAGIMFTFRNPTVAGQPFLHDLLLRVFWRFFAWLSGSRFKVVRFDLAYSEPPESKKYGYVFPGPTRFDCANSAVWSDATWLKMPVRRDSAALRAYLVDAPRNIIVPVRFDDAVSARVRNLLRPGWPDLAAVASRLHVSTATLQRRLAAENTSFRKLKDELRRDIAIDELLTGKSTIDALAQGIGFADSPAFQRAFKRWTGQTPATYRAVDEFASFQSPKLPASRQG